MIVDAKMGPLTRDSLVNGDPELSPSGLQFARTIVNDTITLGQLDGFHVELLSRFNLDVNTEAAPALEPGWRWFLIRIDSTPQDARTHFIWFSAREPGSDYVRVPVGALLGRVSEIERELGHVDGVADDMATAAGRTALLKGHGKSTAGLLRGVERNSNGQLDALRALAADPTTWPPIGDAAELFGTWESYAKREHDA